MGAEGVEYLQQFIHFLVILVDVEQQSQFGVVADDGTVALVGLNDEPVSLADAGVADPALADQTGESGAADDGG
jgi:hypothetical protein